MRSYILKLEKKINKEILVLSWFTIFVLFLALQLVELHDEARIIEWVFLVSAPIVSYLIHKNNKLSNQMFVIILYFGAVWGFGIINNLAHKNNKDLILAGAIAFLLSAIFLVGQFIKTIKEYNLKTIIKNNYLLLIILIVFIIFAFETIFEIPWQDAEYYYCWEIKKLAYWFDYTWNDISNYTLAGHFSLGYSLIALLAELIFPQNAVVLHSFNIVLAIISGVCLYRILALIYPQMKNNTKAIFTSVYLFSPWILGFIGFFNIDVPSIYFFVIWISCVLHGKKLLQTVFAFLFIFTKEPSIVYFAFACLGIIIADYICNKTNNSTNIFLFVLNQIKKFVFEIIIASLWLISFVIRLKSGSNWGGDVFNSDKKMHCFGLSWWNIDLKFKGIFLINFSWIILLIIIIAMIIKIFSRKKAINSEKCIDTYAMTYYRCVIRSTFIGFLLFNMLYIDLQHPRYNAIGAVLLILLGIEALNTISSEKIIIIVSSIISVLMLIQSMVTIDPVTDSIYAKDGQTLHVPYNREFSYYFKALEKALIDCGYDGDEDIVLCGVSTPFGPMNDYWWDTKANRMTPTANSNAFMMNYVWDLDGYNKYNSNHHTRIYIYPYSYVFDNSDVIQRGTVKYRTVQLKYELKQADDSKIFSY